MILAIDVQYCDHGAAVAGVAFDNWKAAVPVATYTSHVTEVAPYEPGAFYRRELPCLLQLLSEHKLQPNCIVVDGYVHLDEEGRPGLGQHLFDALGGQVPIVGVAKTAFAGVSSSFEVLRGQSARPLFVTSAGMSLHVAKMCIKAMHGAHRMPTLLALVDRTCREARRREFPCNAAGPSMA